jgi:hypothetical protein
MGNKKGNKTGNHYGRYAAYLLLLLEQRVSQCGERCDIGATFSSLASGAVFKIVGDALHASFATVVDALNAALAGQYELRTEA